MNKRRSVSKAKVNSQTRKKKVYLSYSSGRYLFVAVGISMLAVALISRLAFLQIIEPEYLTNQADKRSLRVTKSVVHRGNIEDRHGEELAISVPAFAIWVDPKEVKKDFAFTRDEWKESKVVNPKTGLERYTKEYFYPI